MMLGDKLRITKTTICMDVLYCPPPLASGNITHPCISRYLGKILLYIDHHHMESLHTIVQHSGIISLYFNICQNIMTYFYSHLCNVCSIVDFIHMWRTRKKFFLSVLGHRCEVNVAKLLHLDDKQTCLTIKWPVFIWDRPINQTWWNYDTQMLKNNTNHTNLTCCIGNIDRS